MSNGGHDAVHILQKNQTLSAWPGRAQGRFDFTDFIELDPNPAIIFDIECFTGSSDDSSIKLYSNESLRVSELLLQSLISLIAPSQFSAPRTQHERLFVHWLRKQCLSTKSGSRNSFLFESYVWCVRILQEKWVLLRGCPSPTTFEPRAVNDIATTSQTSDYLSSAGRVTVVRCFMSEPLSEHQAYVRDFDWSLTPMGPMDDWDSQLLETVSLTLTNTDPAAVFWGSLLTSVYNEAFITIAGRKHPAMMGDSPANAFVEVWDSFFEPRIQLSRQDKQPFSEKSLCLILERSGFPEETYMDFTFLPLLGYSAEVVGFYHTVTEVTQQVLSKRRMSLLLHVSNVLSQADDLSVFWQLLIQSLSDSEMDTPFITLHSVSTTLRHQPSQYDISQDHTGVTQICHFEGSLGYASDYDALPRAFSLDNDEDSILASIFRASSHSRGTTVLRSDDGTLPEVMISQLQHRGYSNKCNTVVVCPLQPTNNDTALGFLSIGLSSCRPYDADYQSFINLFIKNICTSLASVVLLEDEKRRGLNQVERAAYESAQLAAKLKEREAESQLQEHKFTTMMQQVPVGILDLTPTGEIVFGNQAWYDLTMYGGTATDMDSWITVVHSDDHALWRSEWVTMSSRLQSAWFEARLAILKNDRGTLEDQGVGGNFTWVLVRMSPILSEDGLLRNVTASFTDISLQKYTIARQIRLAEDAVDAKRQQDNFIDMTSHEMRNPLNAMLLCAQELCVTLESTSKSLADTELKETMVNSLDMANTILYCGQHQLRIIDDILTLSKLDAKLLQINPIETHPVAMVQEMLKLFDREVKAQGISMQLETNQSMVQARAQKVRLDPGRVIQILVNFIANAIKFTKTEKLRRVSVRMSATRQEPDASTLAAEDIILVQKSDFFTDPVQSKHWGGGSPLYLTFVVHDTGAGISNPDMLKLFQRFAQNRPKTHSHYGGSGLGLFISQRLAELQGGRVGVCSEVGVGSSFYFHIKVEEAMAADSSMTTGTMDSNIEPKIQSRSTPRQIEDKTAKVQKSDNQGIRVLIVEDNVVNQRVLRRQLDGRGYTTVVANHGIEALSVIHSSNLWRGDRQTMGTERLPIHIILMDIEMPLMDGRECVKQIREYENQGLLDTHVPVIALTANARPDQITHAKQCGFDNVVTKPFHITQIVSVIKSFTS